MMKHGITKEQAKDAALLLIGAVLYGIGIQCFIVPASIASGGATGIALMVNHITHFPVGGMTLVVNTPLFILAWIYLSRRFAMRTAVACVVCSGVMDFLIAPNFPVYAGERLLSSLYGGILVGIGMAMIFWSGSTTGGSDIVGYLVQKRYPHVSIGRALMMIDGFILCSSAVVFDNIDAVLLGLICLYAQTKAIDTIIYGSDAGSKVTIVTHHAQAVSQQVMERLERGATIITGRGAYSGDSTDIIICAVRKSEFSRLKKIVHEIDENAFVMVTETTGVFGQGFKAFTETLS